MKPTNWIEILDFWNETFGTNYTLHRVWLKAAYREFPSLAELSEKLGTNPETLRLKLIKENVKMTGRGKGRKIGNQNWKKRKLKHREINISESLFPNDGELNKEQIASFLFYVQQDPILIEEEGV